MSAGHSVAEAMIEARSTRRRLPEDAVMIWFEPQLVAVSQSDFHRASLNPTFSLSSAVIVITPVDGPIRLTATQGRAAPGSHRTSMMARRGPVSKTSHNPRATRPGVFRAPEEHHDPSPGLNRPGPGNGREAASGSPLNDSKRFSDAEPV